jgi:peptidoglycan-associated lipoprotein
VNRFSLAAVLGMTLLLAACSTSNKAELAATAPVPQAVPETGGVGAAPGSEQDFMLNVGRRIFFAQGSQALDDTARVTIAKQAQWLSANPQWQVKLQGFADDPGSDAQQLALSQKRADAVRNELIAQGVAANRSKAKGYGRERLVGDCAELECKSQNRRVITNLQDGTGQ